MKCTAAGVKWPLVTRETRFVSPDKEFGARERVPRELPHGLRQAARRLRHACCTPSSVLSCPFVWALRKRRMACRSLRFGVVVPFQSAERLVA